MKEYPIKRGMNTTAFLINSGSSLSAQNSAARVDDVDGHACKHGSLVPTAAYIGSERNIEIWAVTQDGWQGALNNFDTKRQFESVRSALVSSPSFSFGVLSTVTNPRI